MSEIILRDPSLLKPGVRFKLPGDPRLDFVQDEFEFIKWTNNDVGPNTGFSAILLKNTSIWDTTPNGTIVLRLWSKEGFVSTGFVILSNIRVEYKRISRRAHDR